VRCLSIGAGLLLLATLAPAQAEATPPEVRAAAAPSRVVVLVGDNADDAVLREAAVRLRAELGAAGFDVVRVARTPGVDLRADMERAAREAGAFAAATISRSPAGATADLWIADRLTRKTVVRTAEVGGASTPSVLAVRAVELLQASLLESSAPRSPAKGEGSDAAERTLPDDVTRWMAPPQPRPGPLEGLGLEAGAAVLLSTDRLGPALGPMLRLSLGGSRRELSIPAGVAARLTFTGPVLGPALGGALGTVSVRQELAVMEAVCTLESDAPVAPVLSAGMGVYHLHASGAPEEPYRSAAGEVWSLAAVVGAGAAVRITERAAVLVDGHALFTEPRPVVALARERLGSAGRPSFAGFLGLLVRL
jgi:hypothetical protein